MARRNMYVVHYKMYAADTEKMIVVIADNKVDAYDQATWVKIPDKEHSYPYSSWVSSVTYNNGNYHMFNTFEGKPY